MIEQEKNMETIRALCAQKTDLSDGDIVVLERLAASLPYVSDLNNCDAFLDCLDAEGTAFVAAESKPRFFESRYAGSVLGKDALRENEPAVYHAFERRVAIHDTKATTQENLIVRQDVTPIENESGRVIGVMICERDVSREASLERKLDVSERERQELFRQVIATGSGETVPEQATVYAREAYHRTKNDLQMLVSICNVRMRQAAEEETRLRLYEMSQLILTVASLNDVLTVRAVSSPNGMISLRALLTDVLKRIRTLVPGQMQVEITFCCDEIHARPERAMAVALALTELITNAINHAFPNGAGALDVSLHADRSSCSAVVQDNGSGFTGDVTGAKGLKIVSSLVTDKLEGTFTIASGEDGTTASFTFLP